MNFRWNIFIKRINYYIYIYTRLYTCLTSIPRFALREKVTLRSLKLLLFQIRHVVGSYVGYFFRRLYIYIYVWKLNQTVLKLDFRAVKFTSIPRFALREKVTLRSLKLLF
jgi:hypothetical protein